MDGDGVVDRCHPEHKGSGDERVHGRAAVRVKAVPCQTCCTNAPCARAHSGWPRVGPRPLCRPARSRRVGVPVPQDPVAPTPQSVPGDRSEAGARPVCLQQGSVSRSSAASPHRLLPLVSQSRLGAPVLTALLPWHPGSGTFTDTGHGAGDTPLSPRGPFRALPGPRARPGSGAQGLDGPANVCSGCRRR